MIDLVRDGAPQWDLKQRGDRAPWGALCRVASSARQRGWTYSEFAGLVTEKRSELGRQIALRGGRKERSRLQVERTLRGSWDAAEKWLSAAPAPITHETVDEKCRALRDLAADPDVGLGDADRAVLAFAIEEGLRRGTDRPTLPRRAVIEGTGLGERTVRNSLDRLDAAGLLVLEVRGVPGGPKARKARASAFRLPAPAVLAARRVTPTTPATAPTTPTESADPKDDEMARITIDMTSLTDDQRATILAVLGKGVATTDTLPANVVPIRRTA